MYLKFIRLIQFQLFYKIQGLLDENATQNSNILQEVNVTVNPNNVCTQQFGLPPLMNTQLCAGDFNPIHDSCQVNLFYCRPLFVLLHITLHKFKREILAAH